MYDKTHIWAALLIACLFTGGAQPLELSQSIALFSQNLFQSLDGAGTNADLILSPFSVFTDLAMCWYGARGSTAAEMQSALQLDGRRMVDFGADIRALLEPLQLNASAVLSVANRIYVQRTQRIRAQFNRAVQRDFFAEAQTLDFGRSAEAAAVINAYVSGQTRGLIPHLMDESMLSADTQMVLVNAVYFKSDWKRGFNAKNTKPDAFYVDGSSKGKSVKLQFMHQTTNFLYADLPELDAIIVGLPYKNDDYMLNVILPNENIVLRQLHASLRGKDVSAYRNRMNNARINLAMPKFTTRFHVSLVGALQKLGIQAAFSGDADFRGLLEDENNVQISEVVHEAYIKVDETGTVAAAATGISMPHMAPAPPPVELIVRINRPFVYYIDDAQSNVYFYGQYSGQSH